jgi:hypothetical protein
MLTKCGGGQMNGRTDVDGLLEFTALELEKRFLHDFSFSSCGCANFGLQQLSPSLMPVLYRCRNQPQEFGYNVSCKI